MMPRVFLETGVNTGQTVVIQGEDGHHFARVLRAKPGEAVAVAALGVPFLCTATAVDVTQGTVTVEVGEQLPSNEPSVRVTLIQGLPKGDKMELILQKCTEAGVTEFIAVPTDRSVAQLDAKKVTARLERWRRLVREAAGQSQRDVVPEVCYAANWDALCDVLDREPSQPLFLLDEEERSTGLASALRGHPDVRRVALAVGPEGGIADRERAWLASRCDAQSITLGSRILRTETAGLAAVCCVLFHTGDMGGR